MKTITTVHDFERATMAEKAELFERDPGLFRQLRAERDARAARENGEPSAADVPRKQPPTKPRAVTPARPAQRSPASASSTTAVMKTWAQMSSSERSALAPAIAAWLKRHPLARTRTGPPPPQFTGATIQRTWPAMTTAQREALAALSPKMAAFHKTHPNWSCAVAIDPTEDTGPSAA